MNAQRKWKTAWVVWHYQSNSKMRYKAVSNMQRYRREAALERIIERQQREIEYHKANLQLAREQVEESEERREFAARLEFCA